MWWRAGSATHSFWGFGLRRELNLTETQSLDGHKVLDLTDAAIPNVLARTDAHTEPPNAFMGRRLVAFY